jgi:hypothetical protein
MELQPRPELEAEQAAKRARPEDGSDADEVLADGASDSGEKKGDSDNDGADGGADGGSGAQDFFSAQDSFLPIWRTFAAPPTENATWPHILIRIPFCGGGAFRIRVRVRFVAAGLFGFGFGFVLEIKPNSAR